MKTLEEIIEHLENTVIRGNAKELIEKYIEYGCDILKAAKAVKMDSSNAGRTIESDLNKALIAMKLLLIQNRAEENIPTYEWTLNEMLEMYETVKNRIKKYNDELNKKDVSIEDMDTVSRLIEKDEKLLVSILKQIGDYQKKFGEMMDEELVRVRRMKTEGLIDYINKTTTDVVSLLNKRRWYELEDAKQ